MGVEEKEKWSPIHYLLATIFLFFIFESIIMSLVFKLDLSHSILDAFFALIFLVPILYFLLYIPMNREILERKTISEDNRKQKEFFRTVIESLSYPFYVVDARNYSILMANTAACGEGGYQGLTCHQMTHKRDTPCETEEHECPLKLVKEKKEPVTTEHIHYDEKGDQRYFEVHGYPIFDEDGNVVQMIEYSIDITQRKIAEENLLDAVKEIKSLDQLKSNILSNVSHELKTPITIVMGGLDLLSEEDDPAEVQDLIHMCNEALLRQRDIVDDLIGFSRMGLSSPVMEEVDLNSLINEVVGKFLKKAERKKISIRLDLTDEVTTMMADRESMNHVFNNIIDNAIKFSPEGGEVIIGSKSTDGSITFRVSDKGIGIREKDKNIIFNPLTQLDPSTRRHYEGTGMGLSVAKNIVEKLGGTIWVESEPGKGSTFYFTLPIKQEN